LRGPGKYFGLKAQLAVQLGSDACRDQNRRLAAGDVAVRPARTVERHYL